jgi:hypothetical protein
MIRPLLRHREQAAAARGTADASTEPRRARRRSRVSVSALVIGLVMLAYSSTTFAQSVPPPGDSNPVVVNVTVNINKIDNIDSLQQTYQMDGYLVLVWTDNRLTSEFDGDEPSLRMYENDLASEAMGAMLWWPTIEFINIVGERDVPNRRLEVHSDGRVIYNERFFATFTSEMDFRRFPFDTQDFYLQIESFSYDASDVEFVAGEPALESTGAVVEGDAAESWLFGFPTATISLVDYPHLLEANGSVTYSRYEYTVSAARNPSYFVWQLLFPLLLIITTSFFVFWISDFSGQRSTLFRLMLTVVAFNFYVSELLPQLPYTTVIDATITSGYVTIFGIIALTLVAHVADTRGRVELAGQIIRASRRVVAPVYCVSLLLLWQHFLW